LETNSYYIETYGCASNKADSYIISTILQKNNYILTSLENAEFIIINTCAVKEQTENKIKTRLKQLYQLYYKNPGKHIIIAGCLPHITPEYINILKNIIPTFSAIIDLDNINEIPEILERIKQGNRNLIFKTKSSIDKAKFFINYSKGKITGIIPISEGCQGSCTYCCVKNARGKLNCYNPQNIIENVNYQLKQGIKQVYLTSQDCSTYKYNSINLFDLVNSIVNLPYKFYLRIGMINPYFLIKEFDQLISIFPDLTISTDIICGFPEETEYDFYRTINFIKWLKPEILNISKFTARPGTEAKKMNQVNSKTIKERSIRLSTIFRNSLFNINNKWESWQGEVLILHKGTEKNQVFGRNYAYKNIFFKEYQNEFGKFVKAKIQKVDGFNLYGRII
jgi:threonylcarbamoyladenosine tRNA methylthiotransferase CDKAL1